MKLNTALILITGILLTLMPGCQQVDSKMPEDAKPEGTVKGQEAAPVRRQDIDEKYRWDLGVVFADEAAWEAAYTQVGKSLEAFRALQGTPGKSPAALFHALDLRDRLSAELGRVIYWAGLTYHLDMKNAKAAGRFDRARSLGTKANEATSWFIPEVLALAKDKVQKWLEEEKKLAVYRHALDDIFRVQDHVLSPREEELLAMAGEVTSAPGTIFGRFQNTDLDFPVIRDSDGKEVQLSSAKYYKFIYSKDRRLRRDAFLGLHKTYMKKRNTISAMLSAQVKQHIFYARARRFKSALESALNGPGIPTTVVENLIKTVHAHLPKLHRYTELRKKVMQLDAVHRYDLRVAMVEGPEEKVPYEAATRTVLAALKPLGKDYCATLQKAFDTRWIDVYETPNKRSGAYSWGSYLAPHPYILLNYGGTRNDRSTLAHEVGHSLHSWYTFKCQPHVYSSYATFCAEVASTVNEVLLSHHLMKHARTDLEKMLIIQEEMENIRTTVLRQTLFADFEKTIHEMVEAGKPLTGDVLCEVYGGLLQKYYGPHITIDDCARAEGMRIPHFYRNFYVYTYATSYCASNNIGRRIIRNEPGAVQAFIRFLSAGSSKYPLEVLKLAGVDMTTPAPIEDTLKRFGELMDQFEALHARL